MTERRYDDDEVRDILARATEVREDAPALPVPAGAAPASSTDGVGHSLTLAELQAVAAEAGIPAASIAEAAASLELDRSALPAPKTQLGVPISTAHVVRLPRMLEADEWDRFVVRLRDTFDARGEVRTEGSLRTWSNGHLTVLLEPLEVGARLRFQSLHSASKQWLESGMAMGVSGALLAAFIAAVVGLGGKPIPLPLMGLVASLPAIGTGMWMKGRSTAARWRPLRNAQFRALGQEAVDVVAGGEEER